MSVALTGGRVVTSLDPVVLVDADVVVEDGRVTAVGSAPEGGGPPGLLRLRDRPGERVRPHPPVLGPGPGHAVRARPADELRRDPPARLVAPRPGARRRRDPRLGPGRRPARRLLAGTTTLIDHHASPNAIDGLARRVRRRARVARRPLGAVLRGDRPRRAGTGRRRRRGEPAVPGGRRPPARPRPGRRPRLVHAARRTPLAACVRGRATPRPASTSTWPRTPSTRRDARRATAAGWSSAWPTPGRSSRAILLAHCVHLEESRARDGPAVRGDRRPQPAFEHEQRGRPRAGRVVRPRRGAGDRRDRPGHVRGVRGGVLAGPRGGRRRRPGRSGRSSAWPRGRRFAGRVFGEPQFGKIEPGAPADLVVLEYDPPTPLSADNLGRTLGVRAVDPARPRRLVAGGVGGAGSFALTGGRPARSRPTAAEQADEAVGAAGGDRGAPVQAGGVITAHDRGRQAWR